MTADCACSSALLQSTQAFPDSDTNVVRTELTASRHVLGDTIDMPREQPSLRDAHGYCPVHP